jgi:hypothetical protein
LQEIAMMTDGHALYYPYIHVHNADWLKMALLYWESVTRIVPDTYSPRDAAYDTNAAVEAGLVHSISPAPYLAGAAKRFRQEFISPKKRRKRKVIWRKIDEVQKDELVDINSAKFDRGLLEELIRLRLASKRSDADIDMQGETSTAYMLCLATEIASHIGAPIVTHDRAAAAVTPMYNFTVSAEVEGTSQAGIPALLKLELPFATPDSLADKTWAEIFAFREQEGALREDFRSEVEQIASSIPSEGDPSYIRSRVRTEKKRLDSLIAKQTRAWDRLHVKVGASVMTLTIPVSVQSVTAAIGMSAPGGNILAGTAVVALGIAWWANYLTDREKVRENAPFQYLLDVRKFAR